MPKSRERKPLHVLEPHVGRGLANRFSRITLLSRFHDRHVWAAFMFINGFITIGSLALLAMITGTPFIFPSLGPTAFLFFFGPTLPTASPRHTIYGHAIGILCGYGALLVTGLAGAQATMSLDMTPARILAAALSLGATGAFMILFKAAHPPAGATTLIISLGIVTKPFHLLIIEVAVALLTAQSILINRLAGIDYPIWAKR
ncbi:MAG TPA: HPP family protein [Blastocatellia bacterium]